MASMRAGVMESDATGGRDRRDGEDILRRQRKRRLPRYRHQRHGHCSTSVLMMAPWLRV